MAVSQFNKAVGKYFSTRSLDDERQIERTLQVLVASADVSLFDPGSKDTVAFFVNLHELMIGVDPSSSLAWAAVQVLSESSRNIGARQSLINTYQFMPILTRFLVTQPSTEKETRLLRLMEELTYGIKISWQEAHLPRLITSLTSRVTSGSDTGRVTLALSVLVNLCYKNLPAVYVLMRSIDIKLFLKSVLKLQSHTESSRVQVCKLMLILRAVTGGVPDPDVNVYLKSVGPTLAEALRRGDSGLMQQTLSFYKELSGARKERTSSTEESGNLLVEVDTLVSSFSANETANIECADLLFEYFNEVIATSGDNLSESYPKLLTVAFQWVRTDGSSVNALDLISSVVCRLSTTSRTTLDRVLDVMDQQLPVMLLLLDVEGRVQSHETYRKLTALLHLLSKMMQVPKFTDRILTTLEPKVFRNIFERLRDPELQQSSLFQETVYMFYIKALAFVQELSDKETSWLALYNQILLQKQILFILSVALFVGSEEVKMKVLQLTTTPGFSLQCLKVLVSCMAELNKLAIFSPSGCLKDDKAPTEVGCMTHMDVTPLLTVTQEGHLDSLLDKFEHATAKNENSVTSAVMELYHFKVAAMSQTMRKMQSGQEAADKRARDLQHNLALTTSEFSRLHHLLHSTQQNLEAISKEKAKLGSHVSDVEAQATELHQKHSQAVQTLRSKTRIIADLTDQLEASKSTLGSVTLERDQAYQRLYDELAAKRDLQTQLDTANQSLSDCKKELAQRKEEIDVAQQKLDQLNKDYLKLERAKEETDAEAAQLNKHLLTISQIAMKRKPDS